MAPVPDGVYRFQDQLGFLSVQAPAPGSPVLVTPDPGGYGPPPVWQIRNNDDGTVMIRAAFGPPLFLGYPGAPQPMMPVIASPEPTRWELRPGFDDEHIVIAVPANLTPDDEDGLVVDLGLMRMFPPRTALMTSQPDNPAQNWYLDNLGG
ncbi:hypothetical protein ABH935_006216 [Catenulispora sp. GAS73]|uniref:hypothetical protein n=1 Tax=Catenulispora sp. GAS73 TaxID=3156269 RepID=UPI0035160C4D